MTIPTFTIEQDPKNDMRFRLTLSEAVIGTVIVEETNGMIHHHERNLSAVKKAIGRKACEMLRGTPAVEWIREHGGFTKFCQITQKPPRYRSHYRAGFSVTFYERDKAMLFKLMWLNVPKATANDNARKAKELAA